MHIHVYMHTHAYISAPCFNPPRPNPISAPIPAYLGTTPKMQLSRKGSSSYMNQLGKGESCQPQRHKCQARSRDTSKRRHWRPKWVLPASCISEKEIPQLLRATEPSLTPPSCCQPIPLNPGDQTSNVILLRRLEGKKSVPAFGKECLLIWSLFFLQCHLLMAIIPWNTSCDSTHFSFSPASNPHDTNNPTNRDLQHLSPCSWKTAQQKTSTKHYWKHFT